MKKIICSFATFMTISLCIKAQSEKTDTIKHLDFQGVNIEGSIDTFKDNMQPRFVLKKRVGAENYYLFEGPMYGHNVYVQAYYTRKSRTPYRVVVSPKNIDLIAWQDSLVNTYGEGTQTEQGLLWQKPEGIILYYAPEGYDTALIYLDSQGNNAFREEK